MTRNTIMKVSLSLLFSLFLSSILWAQKKDFTEEQLLKNKMPDIVSSLPMTSWNQNGLFIISRWNNHSKKFEKFSLDLKTRKEIPYDQPANTTLSNGKRVTITDNDLYLKDGDKTTRLTNDADKEINPTFSPDSNYIAYTKNNNLYTVNTSTLKETQLRFKIFYTIKALVLSNQNYFNFALNNFLHKKFKITNLA